MAKLVGVNFTFNEVSSYEKEVEALKVILNDRNPVVVRENALIVFDSLTVRVNDLFEQLKWASDLHADCSALLDEITSLVGIINGLRLISEIRMNDIETIVRVVLDTTRYIKTLQTRDCELTVRGEKA